MDEVKETIRAAVRPSYHAEKAVQKDRFFNDA